MEEKIAKAREEVGPNAELMFNPVMSFNVEFTLCLAERLPPYGLRWLEEPLIPSDLEGHIELKKAITWIPLATGKDHHGRHAFRQSYGCTNWRRWNGLSLSVVLGGSVLSYRQK